MYCGPLIICSVKQIYPLVLYFVDNKNLKYYVKRGKRLQGTVFPWVADAILDMISTNLK